MARNSDVYRLSIRGAGRKASTFSRAARAIQDDIVREIRALGREHARIFVGRAPKDTGDLAGAIRAVPFFGRASRPRVSIRVDRLRGHRGEGRDELDYLRATREGHRGGRGRLIYPRRAAALKVHTEGHRNPHVFEFRRAVRGADPATDWVVVAADRGKRATDAAERRLARRVESRVLRS